MVSLTWHILDVKPLLCRLLLFCLHDEGEVVIDAAASLLAVEPVLQVAREEVDLGKENMVKRSGMELSPKQHKMSSSLATKLA